MVDRVKECISPQRQKFDSTFIDIKFIIFKTITSNLLIARGVNKCSAKNALVLMSEE